MESTRPLTEEAGSSEQRREHRPESANAGVGAATQLDTPGSSNHERDRATAAKVSLVSAQAKLRLVLGSATVRRATFLAVAVISIALVIATHATYFVFVPYRVTNDNHPPPRTNRVNR
ncbi:hypothetical protein MRX96_021483 [Rhipicephalus microplus]